MRSKEKLTQIRDLMRRHSLDAYIIPSADPHMSEYLPERWRIITWLTGFTGSAGTVVITKDFAGLWTDSRYFIQADEQLQGSGVSLVRLRIPHTPEYIDWLFDSLPVGSRIGYDGYLMSILLTRQMEETFKEKQFRLLPDTDLVSSLWHGRPSYPATPAFEHPAEFSGKTVRDKLGLIREKMEREQADHILLTALDDIAWTFNIRGTDIAYNPVVLSWARIDRDEATLYINPGKIPDTLQDKLAGAGIMTKKYEDFIPDIAKLPPGHSVFISPATTNTLVYKSIPSQCRIKEGISFPAVLKSIKNDTEINHIHNVMIKDGIALTKFFYWLEKNIGKTRITELSAAEKLNNYRAEQEHYRGASFATISSFGTHGAVVHYTPDADSDFELKIPGIFLLDSGGQYLDGTTDITRTIVLGEPTAQQKKDFTLVLKGMISLASCRFPSGTRGYQLDILARSPLWEEGLNYGHGTGHGVGFFLNVHEGPQSIGTGATASRKTVLQSGMIISDEPGLYREGQYGIRTENLVMVTKDKETEFGEFLKFETLALCYIDRKLIDKELLSPQEKEWLDTYHEKVLRLLAPRLEDNLKKWLREKTLPL